MRGALGMREADPADECGVLTVIDSEEHRKSNHEIVQQGWRLTAPFLIDSRQTLAMRSRVKGESAMLANHWCVMLYVRITD